MARYGSDFTSGRYPRMGRGQEMGYDFGYRGDDRWGDFTSGRGRGWNEFEGSRGWGTRGRALDEDLDESWDSMGGRRGYGQGYGLSGSMGRMGTMGPTGSGWRTGSTWGTGSRFGQSGGTGYSRGMRGGFYDRDMQAHRMGHDYDQDLGDRLRHGWNRIREGARGWMGGGRYDRGW